MLLIVNWSKDWDGLAGSKNVAQHWAVSLIDFGIEGAVSALGHPELVAEPTALAFQMWAQQNPGVGSDIAVFPIDPAIADTAAFIDHYKVPVDQSVNCLVIDGVREGQRRIAAVCVPADTRADVNKTVRKALDVRKCSFMSMDEAVELTGMEYGGITPIGVPADWRILIDARVADLPAVIIGAGIRSAKLSLPGSLLASYPGVELIEDLGK
jgi:prolyl-tRNA editing enzyme YbaK/EbsC (Cys-tRNA(Pro) deacylase)